MAVLVQILADLLTDFSIYGNMREPVLVFSGAVETPRFSPLLLDPRLSGEGDGHQQGDRAGRGRLDLSPRAESELPKAVPGRFSQRGF